MVFFVYLDPPVVSAAAASGPLGLEALVGILRGFLQNCVLLDFDDWRWETGVRQALAAHGATFENSLVKKLLAQLHKRNRVVPVLRDDYSGRRELELVAEQAVGAEIDCIVVEAPLALPSGCPAESVTLIGYQSSGFEQKRSDAAAYGREYAGGELNEEEFLRTNFQKLLRFAQRIEVCDAILGRCFGDNFRHSLKRFLGLVSKACRSEADCQIMIHCQASERTAFLNDTLGDMQQAPPARFRLQARLYSAPEGAQCLPHERYLWTDQFALEIGRGMDPLDPRTGTNRDISLNLKEQGQIAKKVAHFSQFQVPA